MKSKKKIEPPKKELLELLEKVHVFFMQNGIKSATMDDIARHLRISKKTLYLYVEDKDDLVKKIMEQYCSNEKTELCRCSEDSKNALDEIISISNHVKKNMREFHPSVIYDLQKYHPEAWMVFSSFKLDYIFKSILQNLERGKKEGYYLKKINSEIIAKLYIGRIESLLDQRFFPSSEYVFSDLYSEMISYHLRGIVSEKGLEYLKKKSKTENIII